MRFIYRRSQFKASLDHDWFVNLFIGETASFTLACVDMSSIFFSGWNNYFE